MTHTARSHFLSRSISAALLLLLLPALTISGASRPKVELAGGCITITAEEATLGSIAEELSRQVGITVYLDRSEETRRVAVDVKNLSFEKGIRALVHPLNYAIVTDRDGRITELRVFKNTGTKENAYKVFAAPRTPHTAVMSLEPPHQAASAYVHAAQAVAKPATSPAQQRGKTSDKAPQSAESLAGPSPFVGGEKAFQYNIWMNQRLKEVEQIQQSMRVKQDQMETQERQTAAVTAMIQASANVQTPSASMTQGTQVQAQQNTGPQVAQGAQAAMAAQQSQAQAQSFMQSNTQQRGFSNYIYYQQRAMRDNYSFYNMRRGQ